MAHLYQNKYGTVWYFRYTDWNGKRISRTGYQSGKETERLAASLEREAYEIRTGIREAPKATPKDVGIDEAVSDYLAWGNAQGGRGGRAWSKDHARHQQSRLAKLVSDLSIKNMSDTMGILPRFESLVREYLSAGLSGKTVNDYRACLSSFLSWAEIRGLVESNQIDKSSVCHEEPTSRRRALSIGEVARLLLTSPRQRSLLYEAAVSTGMRLGELRMLSAGDVNADAGTIMIHAGYSKGRRDDVIRISTKLAQDLLNNQAAAFALYSERSAPHGLNRTVPADPLLYIPANPNEQLRDDLVSAGIPVHIDGMHVDFHALRTTYINLVLAAGVDSKTSQEAARHKSIEMTLSVYGRRREEAMVALADNLATAIGRAMAG